MEFGVYVNQYQDSRSSFSMSKLLEHVERVEALGFDVAALGERHFYQEGFFEPITTFAALAARTSRLSLMSNVFLLPIYHPVHLAEYMANIDQLAGGRTLFAVSLGYRASELENFGVAMDDRVSRFLEGISIIKRLLAGDRFDHHGEHYTLEDVFIRPEPIQSPRPPLIGGGSASVAIKRAAFRCDGYSAAKTDPEHLADAIDTYHEALEEAGKNPADGEITILVDGFVGQSKEDAKAALTPYVVDHQSNSYRWSNPEFEGRLPWSTVAADLVYGSPDDVEAGLEVFETLGVDRVLFRTQFAGMPTEDANESLERFADEVIPRF